MKINNHKLLPNHDQYDLVFIKREYITNRKEGGSRFALYALYRFFVEIEYNIKNNRIVGKKSFVSGEILDKYSALGSDLTQLKTK